MWGFSDFSFVFWANSYDLEKNVDSVFGLAEFFIAIIGFFIGKLIRLIPL